MMATKRKLIESNVSSFLDEPKYDICLKRIFACLPIADRLKMRRVCKRWKNISEMNWEEMVKLNCASSWTWPGTYVFEITLPRLEVILRLCGKNLTHLDFSGKHNMADCQPMNFNADVEFFTLLATHCPKLQILDIYFLKPTPRGIAYMADHCNQITDLRIYDYDSKCNKALSSFFKQAQNLKAITFYGNRKHRSCLVDLPADTLEKIHMEAIYDDAYEHMVSILEKCQVLESFRVESCCLKEKKFTGITRALSKNAKLLKQLEVICYQTSPIILQASHFADFTNLQELKLSCNNKLTDKLLEVIGKCSRQLKSVSFINSNKVTDCGIQALPNLERIVLRKLPLVKGRSLADMSNLKVVNLSYCGITDRSLHVLLDTAENLQLLDFRSVNYHNIKEFILHAITVAKERMTRIPLEIALEIEGKIKEFKRGLLHVRNVT